VNRRLADRSRAKSSAFVPLVSEGRVLAVLALASVAERRAFSAQELELVQSLGNEAALALDRLRSCSALDEALDRERLMARIAGRLRTDLNPDAVLQVAVEETARALDAQRAFVRLGGPGETMPVAAEWSAPGLEPLGDQAPQLPVSNLALRERRTISVADVENEGTLEDASLGDVTALRAVGTRSVLATPVSVFDEVLGVFALHRTAPGSWSESEIAVAEAVAREAGVAVHIARLLDENEEQLRLQRSLFRAAQNVTSELEVETVLTRLVDELAALLGLEAADLYLYDRRRRVLRCAAVHGLPDEVVALEVVRRDKVQLDCEPVRVERVLPVPLLAAHADRKSVV